VSVSITKQSHILWLKHLDPSFVAALKKRRSESRIRLWINNQVTMWEWAQNSADGLKIAEGQAFWNFIGFGEPVRVSLDGPDDREPAVMSGNRRFGTREIAGKPRLKCCFDRYLIADWSGAASLTLQRRGICVADATADSPIERVAAKFTRQSLLKYVIRTLRSATDQGQRLLLGFDYQYGVPIGFVELLGLETTNWRTLLQQLVTGANGVPGLTHAKSYCRAINHWLVARGHSPYFYTATKSALYSEEQYIPGTQSFIVPSTDPRGDRTVAEKNWTVKRLSEQFWGLSGSPKFFNRVGDNGTVGGQTIVGLVKLYELLALTADSIPLAVWPFDGPDLDSPAYEGRHVLVEPYPSGVRPSDVKQTDWDDAKSSVQALREADVSGRLAGLLSFRSVCVTCMQRIRIEGWIALNPASGPNLPADACRFCGNSLNS